jgi:hypothetical protein
MPEEYGIAGKIGEIFDQIKFLPKLSKMCKISR